MRFRIFDKKIVMDVNYIANGNLINVSHKWDTRYNHWTSFFKQLMSFKDSMKRSL